MESVQSSCVIWDMQAGTMHENAVAAEGNKLKEPGPTDRVFKDDCIYCFVTPFFPDGLFVCLSSYVGLCSNHVEDYCRKTGALFFLNLKYEKPDKEDSNEIVHKHSLRIYPQLNKEISVQGSDVSPHLSQIVKTVIDHKSVHIQENSAQGLEWDGTEVFESEVVKNLVQLDVKKEIPLDGWTCEYEGCEIKENLWLNLSDGFVACGRKSHGSKYEGNGHAEAHSRETGFVLVVRVATIEDGVGECFEYDFSSKQYSNDRYVKNPWLKKQLAHFGLDISKFEKTEEHRDVLNANYNMSEFFAIQEKGTDLQAVYGPGFTGLINLGSSCYMNSVLQTLLLIPDFVRVYDSNADQIFASKGPLESHDDFNCQLAKVIHCLQSATEYSKADSDLNGIRPIQFRRVAGKGHYEFSTAKQQDVEQYIRHLFELVDNNAPVGLNPVDACRFVNVNRFEDVASTHVRYRKHNDCILPVTIPMEYSRQSKEDPDRKIISLQECISATFADEIIDGYISPITNTPEGAKQTMKMGSFPDYLLIQLKRFAYTATGEQEKLKVDVEEVDELDLTAYYSQGLQPGEQALPDDNQPKKAEIDEEIVAQIMSMGYDLSAARRAVRLTKNAGAEAAMNYLLDHFDEVPMEDEPGPPEQKESFNVQVRNGAGKYRLEGFVSHIGASPLSGHYVAHLKKNGTWYIFNDDKIALSQNPPKTMGYIYLYKRV